MKKSHFVVVVIAFLAVGIAASMPPKITGYELEPNESMKKRIQLPEPTYTSDTSVEQALYKRRSVRAYRDKPLSLGEISQLLWAAQGITDSKRGFRTSPSAGALYPLEVYVAISNVDGLEKGIYKYMPDEHEVVRISNENARNDLAKAALGQTCVAESAAVILFSAVYERTTQKYGNRGIRYAHMEAGHAAQNVYLQAVSLNLGMVAVGAFRDEAVKRILNMPAKEQPLYLLPIGRM